ncbi:MAG: hypothetical protein LBQ50_05395 [Planctomycetaceae bacterium]|jgi:hypothetical protein|nr:hypothetical protein [Planctomycetaceae bacterium]
MLRNYLNVLFVAQLIVLLLCKSVQGDTEKQHLNIPEYLQKILVTNTNEMKTCTIVWTQSRSTDMSFESLLETLKMPHAYGFLNKEGCAFMWQDGSGYLHTRLVDGSVTNKSGKPLPPAYKINKNDEDYIYEDGLVEKSMDHFKYYQGNGVQRDSRYLSIWPIDKMRLGTQQHFGCFSQYYTTCIGYKFPFFGSELKMPLMSYILFLIDDGEVLDIDDGITLDGDPSILIKIKSKSIFDWNQKERIFTFWLIKRYNYAIKRCEISSLDNRMCYLIQNDNFFEFKKNILYIPRRTTISYYTYLTISDTIFLEPLFKEEISLSEISTKKIDPNLFSLDNAYSIPGTVISSRVIRDTDDGLTFTIPANPADLDRVIEAALTGGAFTPTPLPSTGAIIFRWLLCIAGIAMIFYAGYKKFIKKTQ